MAPPKKLAGGVAAIVERVLIKATAEFELPAAAVLSRGIEAVGSPRLTKQRQSKASRTRLTIPDGLVNDDERPALERGSALL